MKYIRAPIAVLAIFLIVGAIFVLRSDEKRVAESTIPETSPGPTVRVGNTTVRVSVMDTPEERQIGLSGRERLAPDEGMLFIFPEDGQYAFWMKDMRFSIDILWLSASDRPSRDGSEDGRVVYMLENVSPDTYPQSFVSSGPARYVLELPAGFVGRNNVSLGDIVRL
ncbi:MAG: DUF192 domain-containing protein [Patescibacteria group bacterium]